MRREVRRLVVSGATLLLVGVTAPACRRETRFFEEPSFMSGGVSGTRMDEALQLGAPRTSAGPYRGNAWAMSEGQRLYMQMNCVGCHFHGGGGMGPPLMDGAWLYGSEPGNVFDSIVEGRPNGMPAWKGKLSDQQVWQLVAYVRSLSGLQPMDAAPGRDDHMSVAPPPSRTPKKTPVMQEPSP